MMLDAILDAELEESWLKADGFDEAVIGTYENLLVYSSKKCIEILSKNMSLDEAVEYFEFNVISGYVGDKTPIFIEDNYE